MKNSTHIPFPWPSVILAVLVVCWFYIGNNNSLQALYTLPSVFFNPWYQLLGVLAFFASVLFDIFRFFAARAYYNRRLNKHQEKINELLSAKHQLQQRAHTYAGHADKLKLFISERLLEYIEYDEKFLHFKNIAAEVRHNGVICYDKIQTALQQAMQISEDNRYQQAHDSLSYLWDLLDLSTTDNIALHIANALYVSEERYFQAELNDEDKHAATYSPCEAANSALLPLIENEEENNIFLITDQLFEDSRFRIQLQNTDALLGNKNHFILLLENITNNALFYTSKARYKNVHARVAITLQQRNKILVLCIYNHGPLIEDKNSEKIFQLGFSTRQVREHHGKGLGLHFVSQIIQGYEGTISYENICNRSDTLSIRLLFEDGESETHIVELLPDGEKTGCQLSQSNDAIAKKLDWAYTQAINNIEVSSQTHSTLSRLQCHDVDEATLLDTEDKTMPRWCIDYKKNRRGSTIRLTPLDITGVQFTVQLPTAQSRLEYDDEFFDQTEE